MPDAIILYVVAPLLKHLPSFLIAMMDVVVAGLQIFAEVVREKMFLVVAFLQQLKK